jgi:hypothetical protein
VKNRFPPLRRWALRLFFVALAASAVAGGRSADTDYSFRIVQISDTQPEPQKEADWERTAEAIALVNSLRPDLVVFPGDITHNGTEGEYARMKELIAKIEAPVHLVPGNHDNVVWADASEAAEDRHPRHNSHWSRRLGQRLAAVWAGVPVAWIVPLSSPVALWVVGCRDSSQEERFLRNREIHGKRRRHCEGQPRGCPSSVEPSCWPRSRDSREVRRESLLVTRTRTTKEDR